MGVVKQMMMEMEEARWEAADVNFHCPRCEKTVDGHTELPIVYDEGGQEHLPISIQCALCDDVYDAWVKTDWTTCDIQLEEYPKVTVKAQPARGYSSDYDDYEQDYYEWLEQQERPHREVFRTFCQTLDNVEELCSLGLMEKQSHMLRRMLLAQSITAMEVFFSDTLIR